MSKIFTLGELWGPITCDICSTNLTWKIILTDSEFKQLPDNSQGSESVKYIFDNDMGKAICDKCNSNNELDLPAG